MAWTSIRISPSTAAAVRIQKPARGRVEAENNGLRTSRFLRFTPYQLLQAVGRATGAREYRLLKGALARLQSTVIRTTIRHGEHWRRHQFSWINEWEELTTRDGRPVYVADVAEVTGG